MNVVPKGFIIMELPKQQKNMCVCWCVVITIIFCCVSSSKVTFALERRNSKGIYTYAYLAIILSLILDIQRSMRNVNLTWVNFKWY